MLGTRTISRLFSYEQRIEISFSLVKPHLQYTFAFTFIDTTNQREKEI